MTRMTAYEWTTTARTARRVWAIPAAKAEGWDTQDISQPNQGTQPESRCWIFVNIRENAHSSRQSWNPAWLVSPRLQAWAFVEYRTISASDMMRIMTTTDHTERVYPLSMPQSQTPLPASDDPNAEVGLGVLLKGFSQSFFKGLVVLTAGGTISLNSNQR